VTLSPIIASKGIQKNAVILKTQCKKRCATPRKRCSSVKRC
jgi:hypothetical protein